MLAKSFWCRYILHLHLDKQKGRHMQKLAPYLPHKEKQFTKRYDQKITIN